MSRNRWCLLQTKPNQELKVLGGLERRSYECIFLHYSAEVRSASAPNAGEPLFPRYLLVKLDTPAATAAVSQIDGVIRFLKMNNEIVPVQDSLVTALRNLSQQGGGVTDDAWATICPSTGASDFHQHEICKGSARSLQLLELVSQTQRKSLVSSPLRKVA